MAVPTAPVVSKVGVVSATSLAVSVATVVTTASGKRGLLPERRGSEAVFRQDELGPMAVPTNTLRAIEHSSPTAYVEPTCPIPLVVAGLTVVVKVVPTTICATLPEDGTAKRCRRVGLIYGFTTSASTLRALVYALRVRCTRRSRPESGREIRPTCT
ncbi:hypothetical protein KPB2_5339 [Klebsiella pneumoniae Kb677]|nr:hypothetical protein KPB2_5339 [Klebsiella pneumoniae Kb677]